MSNSNDDNSIGRRRFITLAGIGGVGSVTLTLPGEWVTPIFDLVAIPAHAQETNTGARLADIFRKSTGVLDDGNDGNLDPALHSTLKANHRTIGDILAINEDAYVS